MRCTFPGLAINRPDSESCDSLWMSDGGGWAGRILRPATVIASAPGYEGFPAGCPVNPAAKNGAARLRQTWRRGKEFIVIDNMRNIGPRQGPVQRYLV